MVPCDISEKSYRCMISLFSPGWEMFRPTVFTFDFYFEQCKQYSEEEYIERKHAYIIQKKVGFSKRESLSFVYFYFLAEYFSYFFGCPYDTLEDKLRNHDTSFDDIFIDIPEPSRVDHFDALHFCDKNIFCMEKPLSPMFRITIWSCIGDFTSLHVAYEYEYTQQVHLSEFRTRKILYFFLGKRNSSDKFLSNVRCLFPFIFFWHRCSIAHIFSRKKIMEERKIFSESFW